MCNPFCSWVYPQTHSWFCSGRDGRDFSPTPFALLENKFSPGADGGGVIVFFVLVFENRWYKCKYPFDDTKIFVMSYTCVCMPEISLSVGMMSVHLLPLTYQPARSCQSRTCRCFCQPRHPTCTAAKPRFVLWPGRLLLELSPARDRTCCEAFDNWSYWVCKRNWRLHYYPEHWPEKMQTAPFKRARAQNEKAKQMVT